MSLDDNNESSMSNLESTNKKEDPTNESNVDLNKEYDQPIDYDFGWNRYSEITNARFAMIGFLSILIIEILSKKSFFSWIGLIN